MYVTDWLISQFKPQGGSICNFVIRVLYVNVVAGFYFCHLRSYEYVGGYDRQLCSRI